MPSPPRLSCECQYFNPYDPAVLNIIVTDYILPCYTCTYTCNLNTAQRHIYPSTEKARLALKQSTHVPVTHSKFCLTISQRSIGSGFVNALYERISLSKVLTKWANLQMPLTLCAPDIIMNLYTTYLIKASV